MAFVDRYESTPPHRMKFQSKEPMKPQPTRRHEYCTQIGEATKVRFRTSSWTLADRIRIEEISKQEICVVFRDYFGDIW